MKVSTPSGIIRPSPESSKLMWNGLVKGGRASL